MMAYLKNLMKLFGKIKICSHKFIETSGNRRQPKYMTKTSCYKTFRKKDRDKRYIKNWSPISLLNIDTKIEMEICGKENIPGYSVTMDLEKAFDFLDHDFFLCALKKFGFGDSFIDWIKILLNYPQSSVINGGFATQYFTLKRGARQADSISAYLFIVALEVLFALIKNKVDIKGVVLYDHTFLFTAYVGD